MFNLLDKNGNTLDATFKIYSTSYKNYIAYIACIIENTDNLLYPEGFVWSYVYQGREYTDNNYYWIDQPDINNMVEGVNHIAVNKRILFNIRINMFGGIITTSHGLAKAIKLRLYNVTDTKTMIWESEEIRLITPPISVPTIVTEDTYSGTTMSITHTFKWYHDQDFRYYKDDFHVVTELIDAIGKVIRSDTRLIENQVEVIEFTNLNPGKYIMLTKIHVFTGYTMYSDTLIKTLVEKKPNAYIVHEGRIYQALGIYMKVGNDPVTGDAIVKQVESIGAVDIYPKPAV